MELLRVGKIQFSLIFTSGLFTLINALFVALNLGSWEFETLFWKNGFFRHFWARFESNFIGIRFVRRFVFSVEWIKIWFTSSGLAIVDQSCHNSKPKCVWSESDQCPMNYTYSIRQRELLLPFRSCSIAFNKDNWALNCIKRKWLKECEWLQLYSSILEANPTEKRLESTSDRFMNLSWLKQDTGTGNQIHDNGSRDSLVPFWEY
jgi:hypothetical protein